MEKLKQEQNKKLNNKTILDTFHAYPYFMVKLIEAVGDTDYCLLKTVCEKLGITETRFFHILNNEKVHNTFFLRDSGIFKIYEETKQSGLVETYIKLLKRDSWNSLYLSMKDNIITE